MNPPNVISKSSNSNKWFVCPRANSEAERRLFLFPYAGSGPAVFGEWSAKLSNQLEVLSAHYPGRGSRHSEFPIKQITILIEKLSLAIQPLLDKPFAFLGHSLGALVAFEITRQLCRNSLPRPVILFVSGCGSPDLLDLRPPLHGLPDSEFLESLKQINGIASELLH